MNIRTLTAREIECRISQIKKTGLQLLLYKDARCDMAILDETFGSMNWKREHSRDNANCIVSIWDDSKQQWVSKEDTGTESNTEAQKGLASDSFKRACVNWGIGRELYTSPFIWITPDNCNIRDDGGKLKCFDRFEVAEISYNEHREISSLTIVNGTTKNIVYEYGKKTTISEDGIKIIKDFCRQNNVNSDEICKLYKVSSLNDLTPKQYRNICEHLTEIKERFGGIA